MNVFDFFGRNSFAPSAVLFATAFSVGQREFIVLKGNVEVRADLFDELRVISASVQTVMKGAKFEDVEGMSAAKTGERRMSFDFFVEHHAGTVRTFAGTAQRANVTACASPLNYVVSFEFVRREAVDCLNRRVRNFFDLLFGLFHFITPLNLEKRKDDSLMNVVLRKPKSLARLAALL